MPIWVRDICDASKVWAASFLGWTITSSELDVYLKLAIAATTLVYMVGKAIDIWRRVLKKQNNE